MEFMYIYTFYRCTALGSIFCYLLLRKNRTKVKSGGLSFYVPRDRHRHRHSYCTECCKYISSR